MIDQVLSYKLHRTLHCEDGITFAFLLFLHQSEDGIVQQSAESIVEKLPHRHFLMVLFVFNELQQILEHVVVGAAVDTSGHILFTLVFFLDLSHKHFDFFFEKLVTLRFVTFVRSLKFHLDKVCVRLEQIDKALHGGIVPLEVGMLLELQLLQVLIEFEGLAHQLQSFRAYIAQVNFLNVVVCVASLQNSQQAIISQTAIFETNFLHGVVLIGNESISDENASFCAQIVIL